MMWLQDIRDRALSSKAPTTSGRSNKMEKILFEELVFVPAQLSKRPVDYFRERIETKTIIGKNSNRPLVLETPIFFAAMSFGALSKEAKIAVAKASTVLGTATNTGEGGMLPEERKHARLLVAQYSTGRFGVDNVYLKSADAIEIKIGQGAKPGQGGLLPGYKVTEDIAKVRKVQVGKPIHSPPYHPDIRTLNDLKNKVSWLRKASGGKPIIIKLGAGDPEDIKISVKANPDAIAIDGCCGGTGAAPDIMLDDFGIPVLPALVEARNIMDKMKSKQDLLIGGGFSKGADMAKALALGADAIFLGFPLMLAMGCEYCKECYKGQCPLGISTQNPKLRKRFKMDKSVNAVVNYVKACTEEIKMAAAATGNNNVHDLKKQDLRALNLDTSKILGVKAVGL
ncbi:MAG: FMN-binding glutamate synthase family protein [Candidatus Aenigmarchaeota archaeon]|nr:FMN-binding glutamate synthase family protein [Candidatus Aenigmarchaeota archaeon]